MGLKIKTPHRHVDGRMFSWMILIRTFGIALLYPIFPAFVKSIVHTDSNVSLFYSVMALMTLIAALLSTVIFKKVERTTIAKVSFWIMGGVFFFFIFVTRVSELAFLETLRVWFNLFLFMTLALFVRDFARNTDLGEQEGMFYRFYNIGALLGPFIGGMIGTYGYEAVFIMAAVASFTGLGYFYHKHIIARHPALINAPKTTTAKLSRNIKEFFSNPGRCKAYLIGYTMMTWSSFKYLYIPLFVLEAKYLESVSGIILALAIIPLIFLEVRVGKYADKHGVRVPVSTGFLIMGTGLLLIFLLNLLQVPALFSFGVFVLASIGASFVEPLQEYTLFKNLPKEEEENLYGIYATTDPVAYTITPLIGAGVLTLLGFNYLFAVFGGLILLSSLVTWISLKKI